MIELLVVIAIIGLLASVVLLALNSARAKARDSKRLADIKQMTTALELYYNDAGGYPSATSGAPTGTGLAFSTYANTIPTAPTPPDGSCTATQNTYTYTPTGTSYTGTSGATTVYPTYTYTFCLGGQTGGLTLGTHTASPSGIQ